jgi:hypothetical protein
LYRWHVTPGASGRRLSDGSLCGTFVFGFLIFGLFTIADGFEFGVGCAVLGIGATVIVWCVLREPLRVIITTKGKIRFDSIMFSKEYDLETLTSVKVVESDESTRIRLEFSDGRSYSLGRPTIDQFRELATAIHEVNPSVKIDHLPPLLFERIFGRGA